MPLEVECPGCKAQMGSQTLEGHLGPSVTIDLCLACQVFWFDRHESLQLSPASTLKLFRLIGEGAAHRRASVSTDPACPRCGTRLLPTHDKQRNTPFQYWRCPNGHGRLITFFDFLREKNFIRPLSPAQVAALRQNVQTVNCSNCGAPVDLARGSACSHCGSPLSMLDMDQAKEVITQLRQADRTGQPVDPTLPLQMEQARREVERAFAGFEHEPGWMGEVSSSGIVGAGLRALARWFDKSSG
jgi:hypothetical protein